MTSMPPSPRFQRRLIDPKHQRGNHAELIVFQYFIEKGYKALFHQKKIFGVEFDWVFQRGEEKVYVEVKSVSTTHFYLHRWPKRQRERFIKVARVLAEHSSSRFYLAFVDHSDRVLLFQVGNDIN